MHSMRNDESRYTSSFGANPSMKFANLPIVLITTILFFGNSANALTRNGQYCTGTIGEIVKWSTKDRMSILISGSGRYFNLPGKIEESMALTAYATGKPITILWDASITIEDCVNDWPHYKELSGFMVIKP